MNRKRNLFHPMQIRQKLNLILSLVLVFSITSGYSFAQQTQEPRQISQSELQKLLKIKTRTVQHLALNPTLVNAVLFQNGLETGLEEIKKRDGVWKGTKQLTPFKLSLENSPAGRLLKKHVTKNPAFNEGFLTDGQGANVANFPPTSDYWQGDEEKWSASFNSGKGKIFIGPVEFDESSGTYAAQISAPVFHRSETIGVLVMGITVSYLDTKQQ